ncbi:cell division protein ZapE [Porticoccaceae bacterium]|jgi:cell division protein ZapE|nr:cell division protein ZapE [Porticoccaceae bacterium]MDA8734825.1 cell division protein ZapE [Porticoccaceae bacterium]MDB2554677.1 cell division protein ZapE [Porticoccaceae bacterium]MDG1200536.1 cell division protein ZapE [Porticoccaceae bacterium]
MSTPKLSYQNDLSRDGFVADASQAQAVEHLEALYQRLVARQAKPAAGILGGLLKRFAHSAPEPEKGLYFWGGVGRGKTYLMDNFFETLPFERKMRVHFHRFMRRVHQDLKRHKGQTNPLVLVADTIADETCIICFDEFFVSDITDAMILGLLLEELFARGVCLVATSNIVPDQLYLNGLQRQRFLPAIALLNKHCKVVNVDGGIDHRLRALEKAELYHSPLDADADRAIQATFESLVPVEGETKRGVDLDVEGRPIPVLVLAEDIVWFDFSAICEGPRSQNDYIEIAREFHAVMISNVPALGLANDDAARRFINLVDEFYDRSVKLALSASEPLASLYSGGRLEFEFARTESRLLEMQSREYLARPHRP